MTPTRSLLCRFGLHRWSTNRGGIKVCRRDGCEKARLYGLTGAMRRLAFEQDLYDEYHHKTTPDDHGDGS